MDPELIAQVLDDACQYENLNFQIMLQESILHIYINRTTDIEIDYDQLIKNVTDALISIDQSWEGFWLYSRIMGEIEPDWQTYIKLQDESSDAHLDPFIEEAEDLIKKAKDSLEDLKYLKDEDVLSLGEISTSLLDTDSNLLAIESGNETKEESEDDFEDFFVVEEIDEAVLDKNSFLLAIDSADEIDNSTGEAEEEDEDIFAVEELDDAVLNQNSFLLAIDSADEIDNSTGEAEEEDEDLFAVEELDDSILDKNSFLLAIDSADEIDNSTGEAEEEDEDLFAVEELDDSILDKNSNLIITESTNQFDSYTEKLQEQDNENIIDTHELEKKTDELTSDSSEMSLNDIGNNLLEEIEEDELYFVEESDKNSNGVLSNNVELESNTIETANNNSNHTEEQDIFAVNELDNKESKMESEDIVNINHESIDKNIVTIEEPDQSLSQVESKSLDDISEDNVEETENSIVEKINLAEYCFIRNQRLLESDLVTPKSNISQLVSFFHDLSVSNKKLLLPLLTQHFKSTNTLKNTNINKEAENQFDLKIQEWLQQLSELNLEENRKAAIWFSRYCFNSEKTIEEIKAILNPEANRKKLEKQQLETSSYIKKKQDNSRSSSYSHGNKNNKHETSNQSSNYLPSQTPLKETIAEQERATGKLSGKSINLLVPVIWTAIALFFVVVGIIHTNSSAFNAEGIPVICENVINAESTDYCTLAVDLVGQDFLKEVSQEATPFSSETEYMAMYHCEKYANIQAGFPLFRADPLKEIVINSSGTEILPGIYFAEAQQNSFKKESEIVRVGCTFVNQEGSPGLLASDVIPNNWPVEEYSGTSSMKQLRSLGKSLGIYSIFVVMGFGTLFTAIGLFIASMMDWGITINSMNALYKSAFILGMVEVLFSRLPIFGFFAVIALQALALGITSACIKGFKVNWSDGYPVVFLGAVTILGVRKILHLLLILLISSFIA